VWFPRGPALKWRIRSAALRPSLRYGFQQVEASPTLVRYRCGDLEARVFHGPRSHELGFEIEREAPRSLLRCINPLEASERSKLRGIRPVASEGERFDISESIALSDPSAADCYRNPMVRTPSAVNTFPRQLADLVRRYGERALSNDPAFYKVLRQQHKVSVEQYRLEARCSQIRPKAEAAFREGRYREAAELYREIRAGLTPAEIKKLAITEKRSLGGT
jgi:hypothetical protein